MCYNTAQHTNSLFTQYCAAVHTKIYKCSKTAPTHGNSGPGSSTASNRTLQLQQECSPSTAMLHRSKTYRDHDNVRPLQQCNHSTKPTAINYVGPLQQCNTAPNLLRLRLSVPMYVTETTAESTRFYRGLCFSFHKTKRLMTNKN